MEQEHSASLPWRTGRIQGNTPSQNVHMCKYTTGAFKPVPGCDMELGFSILLIQNDPSNQLPQCLMSQAFKNTACNTKLT